VDLFNYVRSDAFQIEIECGGAAAGDGGPGVDNISFETFLFVGGDLNFKKAAEALAYFIVEILKE